MNQQSRRDFMARSAAAAGALALGGSRLMAADQKPVDMTIARWAGPKDPSPAEIKKIAVQLTETAIQGLGGLKRFVSNGAVVWVKPNIAWDRKPEQAANTNPDVLSTIIRLCFEAGAKTVKVGDNPCNQAAKTYVTSGLAEAAKAAGAEVVFLDTSRFREMDLGGERVKKLPIYPGIVECDLAINVPIVKHHQLSELTMCMKNYMGVMEKRNTFHQNMPACLVDIARFMKPKLCILDAVRVLAAHGPTGGRMEDVQTKLTVAAGVDIVALDAFGAELMGKQPAKIGSVAAGAKAGLGKIDYRSLNMSEIAVS